MRLSLGVATSQPVETSVELAREAEASGYGRVWVGEDIPSREVFTYLSILALRTGRLGIGTGITSPYVRKITTLAASAAGVQHLSGGRFTLGIGPGGLPEVEKVTGRPPHDVVDVMWEAATVLRRIFQGETVSHQGVLICLSDYLITHPGMAPMDIYFGVRGPRLLALAGELADGVILSGPLDYLARGIRIVEESAAGAGRDPGGIVKVLWNAFAMTGEASVLKSARPMVATMLASLPEAALEHIDIKRETLEEVRRLFALSRYEDACALIEPGVIKEFMIAGDRAELEDQLERCRRMGFDEVVVGPPYGEEPRKVIREVGGLMGGGR
ncbi:MAG: LLM class flavin-dependent oxidoreductase [Euryarchaeota archaeon]|nr:LLM class flavin-dependent oxidoreductase [Euryarchaeota archaeon]